MLNGPSIYLLQDLRNTARLRLLRQSGHVEGGSTRKLGDGKSLVGVFRVRERRAWGGNHLDNETAVLPILRRKDGGGETMSTVYGRKIGTDSTLGVKCDICGEIYWTDLTGQSFPDHVREAVQHGWKNTKQNGKWLNLCPECDEYRRKQKREATLTKDCTGCRWKDRPQKCSCCRRNQNLKDCYEEAQK